MKYEKIIPAEQLKDVEVIRMTQTCTTNMRCLRIFSGAFIERENLYAGIKN